MSKFINSKEAIVSPLLLWQEVPTQVSIQETYDLKVWPVSSIFNEGPINFVIPPQPNGMLRSVNIVTKFRLNDSTLTSAEAEKIYRYHKLGIINNFASSLWDLVQVRLDDRVDVMQSMRNAYAYQTFFNNCLNTESSHADFLFNEELFLMDEGDDKEDAQDEEILTLAINTIANKLDEAIFELEDGDANLTNYNYALKIREVKSELADKFIYHTTTNSKNPAVGKRSSRVNKLQSTTVNTPLHCPLFTTSKCLPTNMKIRISLSKNTDAFLLNANKNVYSLIIEDVHLDVRYFRPRDTILRHIEEHIVKEPIPYFITKPEIIIKPIPHSNRIIRLTNLFPDKTPKQAFFTLLPSADFNGQFSSSPFVFIPFHKFQISINGKQHFVEPLETNFYNSKGVTHWQDVGDFHRQLYRVIGRDLRGDCLINSNNFLLNFMAAVSFTADRSNTSSAYLNLQEHNSTSLEIDMGYDEGIPKDMIMIIYALFDRQIQIDHNRAVTVID